MTDPEQFEGFMSAYQDMVYSTALRLSGNESEAEDIAQETFLRAFENLRSLNDGHALSQWLTQITTNLVRDRWKTRKKTVCLEEDDPNLPRSGGNPAQDAEIQEMRARIQAALMELPHAYREVFLLKYVEEISYEEIRDLLKISVSAAKVQAYRACRMLRKLLPEYDPMREMSREREMGR